jgi:hypothetical protein
MMGIEEQFTAERKQLDSLNSWTYTLNSFLSALEEEPKNISTVYEAVNKGNERKKIRNYKSYREEN